jgi:branched-chain amino acid transport system ATP-binding protein
MTRSSREIEDLSLSEPLFEIKDLTLSFGGLVAVAGLDLVVNSGEIVGLIGPNGAGKTTVFNCISRFYDPDRGRIRFKDHDITRARSHEIAGFGIARTFQNVELCRSMTALENLLVGQHLVIGSGVIRDGLGLQGVRDSEHAAIARADEMLGLLGLTAYRDRVASTLAFGVQKLIELGRALVSRPSLLLLDEPAAGAETHEARALATLIRQLRERFDLSVLVVEHDMPFVMGLCDRLYVLDFGRKIAEGPPAAVRNDRAVIEAYLGEPEPAVVEV